MSIFKIILSTAVLQMKHSFSRSMYKFCLIYQPVIYLFITYMMYRSSGSKNFASFVILGSGITTLWSCICYSSAGDIDRERFMGTLEIIYGAPVSFKVIVSGKILGNTLLGMLPLLATVSLSALFAKEEFLIQSPAYFAAALLLTLLAFLSISFVFAGFFTISRRASVLMNCMSYPVFILCGFLIPADTLPKWLHPVSNILSPTWAMRLLTMSIEGMPETAAFKEAGFYVILTSTVYLVLSYILFYKMDRMVRIKATLGVS